MSNFVHRGKLAYGFIDQSDNIHYDFELRLLTIQGEINSINTLLVEYPDLNEMPESEKWIIERAASLAEMILISGKKLTINEVLGLQADEFTVLMEAEVNLRKKRSEPIQRNPEAQAQKDQR